MYVTMTRIKIIPIQINKVYYVFWIYSNISLSGSRWINISCLDKVVLGYGYILLKYLVGGAVVMIA